MIGVFDSGSGGLTVLRTIRERLPSADIVYFGDIKNAPYGSKPHDELFALTLESIDFLKARGATRIVSACNSISTALAMSLADVRSVTLFDFIEMVGPTVSAFKKSDARILLCATPATVRSKMYRHVFQMIGKNIHQVAIRDLAGAIENGAPVGEIEQMIAEAFAEIDHREYNTLILACTHYPLVADSFRRVLGDIDLFDPAEAVAHRVEREWQSQETGNGATQFFITQESESFRARVASLFPRYADRIEVVE